jgi:hypothetical protein
MIENIKTEKYIYLDRNNDNVQVRKNDIEKTENSLEFFNTVP